MVETSNGINKELKSAELLEIERVCGEERGDGEFISGEIGMQEGASGYIEGFSFRS